MDNNDYNNYTVDVNMYLVANRSAFRLKLLVMYVTTILQSILKRLNLLVLNKYLDRNIF